MPSRDRSWARHDIRRGGSEISLIRHPRVGDLRLRREKLAIVGTDLQIVLYHAEPSTPSADGLTLLATLAVTDDVQPSDASRPDSHRAETHARSRPAIADHIWNLRRDREGFRHFHTPLPEH
ncbi:hypothetical protein [Cryptosporangium aurantiacum]|uniref:MmyB family transcriptional regulator n=1 Tax=Cryptosporangium aurantiacum TaxID=134849 RepID=UPI0015BD4976